MVIVQQLKLKLPKGYVAGPHVHIGALSEVDVAALERDPGSASDPLNSPDGEVATAMWAPAVPSLLVESAIPDEDEYEVRVYDVRRGRRLVASIEIVSPGNKDRPDNRLAFVAKCADLMRKGIAVSIVDLVTVRNFNLYVELLSLFGQVDPRQIDPKQGDSPPSIYAGSCRWTTKEQKSFFEMWSQPLAIGASLPTLPIWLSPKITIPLDLELSYEKACSDLSID